MDVLRSQFEDQIAKSISNCQKNKGSFEELYSKLANMKQLPRGVFSGAEQAIDAPVNSIVVFLNRLTRNTQKKSIKLWNEYLDKNFTSLKDSIVTQEAEGNQEMMEDDEETADDEKAEDSTGYRPCSASFTSIIRKDLSKNVRLAFVDTINKTVESASDYIADFSKQIMKILLLFKHNQFTIENGKIQFVPREVQSLASLLPANYLDKDVLVPKPLDRQFLQNDDFKEEFDALFHEAHFDQIHSTYFGSKGISKSTLNAARFHSAIVDALECDKDNVYSGLSSHVIKMAKNALGDSAECSLSPARDQKFKKKREELKGRRKGEERARAESLQTTIVLSQYTQCHSLIKPTTGAEDFLLKRLTGGIIISRKEVIGLSSIGGLAYKEEREARREHEHQQEDDLAENVSTEDVSLALFEDKDITVEYLADKMSDINDKETNAILKNITFVKPYMASRDTYHQFSQQVLFLFMTNQVLHSLGYLYRVVKFTPVIKPTSLHALKMVIYDFEGNIIRAASVTSQKDAIFSSFFDIDRLKTPKNKQQEQQRPVAHTSSGSDDKGNDMIAALVEQKAVIQRKLKNAQTALNNYLVGAESASQLKKSGRTRT
ncbi:hypothetical protein [Parasitella parasitica]|uniref:Uncharacterized protein n=1 Tax=Parasitella parasitica TaxID=35722 RepID=A0A0B7NHM1_9FUNG|nr:hypothetical protein [Parasitella parasitica]